jgi:N-hydroxyarylamine O-acetyltransferase
MNGVFGRVLETLGFEVRYLSGAVGRATRGWRAQGNHLVLLVGLDRRWIADVGFGDGFLTPLPLEPGNYWQGFLQYRVSRDGPRWHVQSHEFGGADGFDFTLTPRALDEFGAQCRELQTSPESSFVKSTVCERFVPTGLVMLRGAVLREVSAGGVTTHVVQDAAEYDRALRDRFDLAGRASTRSGESMGAAPAVAGRTGHGRPRTSGRPPARALMADYGLAAARRTSSMSNLVSPSISTSLHPGP